MSLDQKPQRLLQERQKIRHKTCDNEHQIIINGSVSAVGQVLPPLVIFEGQSLNSDWLKGKIWL